MGKKCDNYETCKKYAIYGVCESSSSIPMYCDVYQKQMINILSSIDEKLEKLNHKETL